MATLIRELTPGAIRALEHMKHGGKIHAIDRGSKGRNVELQMPGEEKPSLLNFNVFSSMRRAGVLKMTGGSPRDGHYIVADSLLQGN